MNESPLPTDRDMEYIVLGLLKEQSTGTVRMLVIRGPGALSADLTYKTVLRTRPVDAQGVSDGGLALLEEALKSQAEASERTKGDPLSVGRKKPANAMWLPVGGPWVVNLSHPQPRLDGHCSPPTSSFVIPEAGAEVSTRAEPAREPDVERSPVVASGQSLANLAEIQEMRELLVAVRAEISKHANATENDAYEMKREFTNLSARVSALDRNASLRSVAEGQSNNDSLERVAVLRQMESLAQKSDDIGRRVVDMVATGEEVLQRMAEGDLSVRTTVGAAVDEIIAETTKVFRAALPDLNRRFSDGQAVLVRLDRSLRRILDDFDVADDLRTALLGQMDDHLREADVTKTNDSSAEAIYADSTTQRTL